MNIWWCITENRIRNLSLPGSITTVPSSHCRTQFIYLYDSQVGVRAGSDCKYIKKYLVYVSVITFRKLNIIV